jgi:hypothetical protein
VLVWSPGMDLCFLQWAAGSLESWFSSLVTGCNHLQSLQTCEVQAQATKTANEWSWTGSKCLPGIYFQSSLRMLMCTEGHCT